MEDDVPTQRKQSIKQVLRNLDPKKPVPRNLDSDAITAGYCRAPAEEKPAVKRFHTKLTSAIESLEAEIGKQRASSILRHHIGTLHKAVN
ncbi:MAG: hypothetical protein ABSG52_16695 [Terriglobales bacterium]